jgi:hypothetical protein
MVFDDAVDIGDDGDEFVGAKQAHSSTMQDFRSERLLRPYDGDDIADTMATMLSIRSR